MNSLLSTRSCLCLLLLIGGASARMTYAQSVTTEMTTYTYKRVGDLEIKADVLRAADDVIRPVVISIHGGRIDHGAS